MTQLKNIGNRVSQISQSDIQPCTRRSRWHWIAIEVADISTFFYHIGQQCQLHYQVVETYRPLNMTFQHIGEE